MQLIRKAYIVVNLLSHLVIGSIFISLAAVFPTGCGGNKEGTEGIGGNKPPCLPQD